MKGLPTDMVGFLLMNVGAACRAGVSRGMITIWGSKATPPHHRAAPVVVEVTTPNRLLRSVHPASAFELKGCYKGKQTDRLTDTEDRPKVARENRGWGW